MTAHEVMDRGSRAARQRAGLAHFLAFVSAFLTLVMICAGAIVTSMEAGDSDPEWSFAFWEWFRGAQGGLFFELLHRQIGTAVGVVVILAVISIWRDPGLKPLRRIAIAALGLVVAQGILGGLRVRVVSDPEWRQIALTMSGGGEYINPWVMALSMVHAFTAHLFFCCAVSLVVATSKAWRNGEHPTESSPATATTRLLIGLATAAVFAQLLLGAFARHSHKLLDGEIVWVWGVVAHASCALLVAVLVFASAGHARLRHPGCFPVWHLGGLAKFLVLFQIALGLASWLMTLKTSYTPPGDVRLLVRVGHVANGAMILAVLVTALLRSFKLLKPEPAQ